MAQLSKVVSSILRDMVLAQHEANLYALRLAEPYKNSGKTDNFPLPSVALGEMDLEIKYGVIDASVQQEQFEIDYIKLGKVISKLSPQLSEVIISTVVSTVISALPEDIVMGTENLIRKLDDEGELLQKFSTFLSRKLLSEMQRDLQSLVNADGTLCVEVISDIATKVGCEVVIYHQDLNSYFDMDHGDKVRQKAGANLSLTIDGMLTHFVDGINVMQKELYQSLNIAISSDELAKYPKESIHTFHFKIVPRDMRMDTEDDQFNNKR